MINPFALRRLAAQLAAFAHPPCHVSPSVGQHALEHGAEQLTAWAEQVTSDRAKLRDASRRLQALAVGADFRSRECAAIARLLDDVLWQGADEAPGAVVLHLPERRGLRARALTTFFGRGPDGAA